MFLFTKKSERQLFMPLVQGVLVDISQSRFLKGLSA